MNRRPIPFAGKTPPGAITQDALRPSTFPIVSVIGWAIFGAIVGKLFERAMEESDDEYDAE